MSDCYNGAFEIVSDVPNESVNQLSEEVVVTEPVATPEPEVLPPDTQLMAQYVSQAINDGYAYNVCQEAVNYATADTQTYEDFEELLYKVVENKQALIDKQNNRNKRIKDSIEVELTALRKYPDIATRADALLQSTYNTTAVLAMDVINHATNEELCLELYEKPIYSVMLQVNKDWVKEKVNILHNNWEKSEYANKFVESYLRYLGVTPEAMDVNKQALIKLLPMTVQQESSPDIYKAFLAVQLIQQRDNPNEEPTMFKGIMSDPDIITEYGATFQDSVERGQPIQVANAEATEEALEKAVQKKNLLENGICAITGGVGAFCGKAIHIRYQAATTFDEMLRENAGPYVNNWVANKQKMQQRKAEKKQRQYEEYMAAMAQQREQQMQQTQQTASMNNQTNINNNAKRNTNVKKDYVYNPNISPAANFMHRVPILVWVILGHLIAYLIVKLLWGSLTSSIFLVGFIIALFGFLKKRSGDNDFLIVIVAGYIISLLAVVFH